MCFTVQAALGFIPVVAGKERAVVRMAGFGCRCNCGVQNYFGEKDHGYRKAAVVQPRPQGGVLMGAGKQGIEWVPEVNRTRADS